MQTFLSKAFKDTPEGHEADEILRSCVHCGFCNATCPTYQLLGDERDGPRGRIYLIKEMLEHNTASRETQLHLDRCLTCLACETTCPSGVQYNRLLEIGRAVAEAGFVIVGLTFDAIQHVQGAAHRCDVFLTGFVRHLKEPPSDTSR